MISYTPTLDTISGCLLGLALGDAIGAPFEGMPPGNYSPWSDREFLRYTDDTEMMINMLRAILVNKGVDTETIARYFYEGLNPKRGYGPGTLKVLSLIKEGMPVHIAAKSVFPEGSFGNGAAMRVAPLGLVFYGDESELEDAVKRVSIATHTHPFAIDGARVIALSVSYLVNRRDISALPGYLLQRSFTQEFTDRLERVSYALKKRVSKRWVVENLGTGVIATESVPTALYAFLRYGKDFKELISFCISLGGDTDTISAMAGALSGTMTGKAALPFDFINRLENRGLIEELSNRLYEMVLS